MKNLIDVLSAKHKKQDFECDQESLNNYLHKIAKHDVKRKIAACFVLSDEDNNVKGYYTLSNSSIDRDIVPEEIKKKLPKYSDLPVTLLGRLAVSKSHTGNGFGKLLLIDALKKAYEASKVIGSVAVVVDPIDENAKKFYEKYGFIELDSGKMFLRMNTIAELFK